MAIEVEGCQAVCSSIAEDLPVLYETGSSQTFYCEADSSEPLSEGVADLALVSPPAKEADPQCEDQSLAVLSAHGAVVSSSDTAQGCQSTEACVVSVAEAAVESLIGTGSPLIVAAETFDENTFGSRSCFESNEAAVELETTTAPNSMCNNSAGPAVATASPSALAVCAGFFLDSDSEDSTTVPWSPSMEPGLELKMDLMPGTVNQDNAVAEEELHEPDSSGVEEFTSGEVAEESSAVEKETAGTDLDSEKQSNAGSDDMEISFTDSFIEKVDGECGDLDVSDDRTYTELELLDNETRMEDTATGASDEASTAVTDSCVASASVYTSTAAANSNTTDVYNTCDFDSSDNCSNIVSEEGSIMPPKITAAIVVQSNTSYMSNSSSDDDEDEEDGEVESSDCESLLGRDSPSPPSVDDSSLFPSVEEVETRTGISFESSGPSCSAPSFSSAAGVPSPASGFSSSTPADTRRKAITLIDLHFRQITDVERDLRRYVLHKTNLNRLYQEIREEKLNSHRRQRSSTNHHHHHQQQHHHHSAAQNNINNLPSSSFLSNPSVSPLTARSSSPLPFGDSGHLNPQSYNRSGAPFTMAGDAGSGGSSTFCRQSVYSGQASAAQSCGGQHDDCQDALLEPAHKRVRLSCPAEEDKENKFSSAPPTASVFGSGGHSYTPATVTEFYHHQVGCSSVSCAPTSSCGGDVTTTSTSTHYSGCNSTGSSNGYYQNQASSAYGTYYNNNSYYPNNMSFTPNGQFLGNFGNSSSDSNGTCNHSSSSNSSSNGNYSMATGAVEADPYNNGSNNNCNNVNSLDRGLPGFNNNLSSSSSNSCSDSIGFRSNNDIIIEHIDEEIRRQNSITSNNRPSSCPPFSSSSSSLFSSSSSIFSSSSYFSQSLSSSQASSSTPSLYNTGNNSLQYNNLNHFSGGTGWNSSYSPLYGTSSSSSGPTHSSPPQQQPLQPYPCGRSSLMRGGNDFQSVVYSSLLASLET